MLRKEKTLEWASCLGCGKPIEGVVKGKFGFPVCKSCTTDDPKVTCIKQLETEPATLKGKQT